MHPVPSTRPTRTNSKWRPLFTIRGILVQLPIIAMRRWARVLEPTCKVLLSSLSTRSGLSRSSVLVQDRRAEMTLPTRLMSPANRVSLLVTFRRLSVTVLISRPRQLGSNPFPLLRLRNAFRLLGRRPTSRTVPFSFNVPSPCSPWAIRLVETPMSPSMPLMPRNMPAVTLVTLVRCVALSNLSRALPSL